MVTCNCDEAKSGNYVDNACRAHMQIMDQEVTYSQAGAPQVKLRFSILAATDPAQVGKEFSNFFPCSGGAVNKFLNVAEAAGLISAEQHAAAVKDKTPLDIDETLFKGRQICGDIAMERKQIQDATGKWIDDPTSNKAFPQLGFNTYSLFANKAKDVPKDQQMLAMLTQGGGGHAAAPIDPSAATSAASAGSLQDMF